MSLSKDQNRRRKLTERQWRQMQRKASALPKDKIADVVHQAVCRYFQDDGFRHCAHYALAGCKLVSNLTGKFYIPQAGDLSIICDGDLGIMMDASQDGVLSGEFHSWIVGPVNFGSSGHLPMPQDMEVIDFASRHYRRYIEEHRLIEDRISLPGGFLEIMDSETPRITWKLPDPPNFIWTEFRNLPNWVRISANQEATEALLAGLDQFEPLARLIMAIWKASK